MIGPYPRPIVEISVDGQPLSSALLSRLIRLTHTDNRGFEADTVDIELDDSDGLLDLPARGAEIRVALGWAADGLVDKGSYTVDEVAHTGAPDILSIRAHAADLRSGLTTQRERAWHATTIGAIVRTIADENGLIPVIPAGLAGQAIDHIDQTNESSANLLTRLAEQFDAIATVKDGRLLFIPAGGGITASGRAIPTVVIARQSGDRHQFTIADRQTYTAVRATYYDTNAATKGEVVWGTDEDSAERNIRPVAPVAVAGQYKQLPTTYPTRAKAQRAAAKAWKAMKNNKAQRAAYIGASAKYDDRNLHVNGTVTYGLEDDNKKLARANRQAARDATQISGTENAFQHSADNLKTLRHVYSSKANAARAARAEWRRLQRGMATFTIALAKGIPELIPETPAIVAGFKPQIDSTDWLTVKVTNQIDDSGYTQRIELEIKATEIPG